MKRTLALLATVFPLYLFGQGFGSFSGDQPFLASSSSLISTQAYATNLTFRWVASDLPTNVVMTNWTDRINGFVQKTNVIDVTNATDKAFFTRTTGVFYGGLTNVSGAAWPGTTNYAVSFMMMPFIPENDLDNNSYNFFQSGSSDYAFNLVSNFPGSSRTYVLADFTIGTLFGIVTNSWFDFTLIATNNTTVDERLVIYTNGVFCKLVTGYTVNGLTPPNKLWPRGNHFLYGFQGYVHEIWYRTNGLITPTDIQNHALDLHYTRTNLYGSQ